MQLILNFRGIDYSVQIDNVTEQNYKDIVDHFYGLLENPTIKLRDSICTAFCRAVQICPTANPSDLWHHIIYRSFLRYGCSSQSWVRASGEGFELSLMCAFNPYLEKCNIRFRPLISGIDKLNALKEMGIQDKVGGSKIDIAIERKLPSGIWNIIGGIHAKASLAERVSDDIPASLVMMEYGFISLLVTLDVKSFPPPHGDLVNRGELGTLENPSDKRKYIEHHGAFSAAFREALKNRLVPGQKFS